MPECPSLPQLTSHRRRVVSISRLTPLHVRTIRSRAAIVSELQMRIASLLPVGEAEARCKEPILTASLSFLQRSRRCITSKITTSQMAGNRLLMMAVWPVVRVSLNRRHRAQPEWSYPSSRLTSSNLVKIITLNNYLMNNSCS